MSSSPLLSLFESFGGSPSATVTTAVMQTPSIPDLPALALAERMRPAMRALLEEWGRPETYGHP